MGKGQCKAGGSKTYLLKLDMHCQCNGCVKKITDGVKEISLSEATATGVERTDVSAETGEVRVKVTGSMDMDPEKLCILLQEATKKKCVRIVQEESVVPSPGPGSGRIARPGQTKNTSPSGQVPSDWIASEAAGWRRHGTGTFPATTPSAPPLPEEEAEAAAAAWIETTTAPSERCRYRWASPGSTLGVWAASEITGTLAMYHL